MTTRFSQEDIDARMKENPDFGKANRTVNPAIALIGKPEKLRKLREAVGIKGNKYHVSPKDDRTYNGKVYHSKKEATRAHDNDLRIRAGELDFYLEQVGITLPGGKKYRLDFLEFRRDNQRPPGYYSVHFVEVKPDGKFREPVGEVKRSVAEAVLGIKIEIV